MAHVAKINELAGSLLTASTGFTSNDPRFTRLQNEVTKGLRVSSHARTNQFDVRSKLDGLVEKFVVLNRDDLAEELQSRLDELPTKSKWLPEILSLLLLLSDRPAEKTHVADLYTPDESAGHDQVLTWKAIFDDDPLDETGLWNDVQHGYHSSGDEATGDEDDLTTSTTATSVGDRDFVGFARIHILTPDESTLNTIKSYRSQFVKDQSNLSTISELTIVRETLSMLQGLPTSIYSVDDSTGKILPNARFVLGTATRSSLIDMMTRCADMGSSLGRLRTWLRTESKRLYLQSCQAAVHGLLMELKMQLATIEQRYLSPGADAIVSFIDVRSGVETLLRSAIRLSQLIERSTGMDKESPYALLDSLYEEICIGQMSGDAQLTAALSNILFAGLRTYLKPVSAWVRNGSITDLDEIFFVFVANDHCEPGEMWHESFAMRTFADGQPVIPKFMQNLATKAFAIGKSRAFWTALTGGHEEIHVISHAHPDLTWSEDQVASTGYTPFSQWLDDKLDAWLIGIGQDCTPQVCSTLRYEHGLLDTLDGLGDVFCSRDNRLFQTFADTLFWRMDAGKSWRDRFLLTELAQSTLGNAHSITPTSITITVDVDGVNVLTSSIAQLDSLQLELLFPWPIQNITRSSSPVSYSRTFTFLLQVYRAKYLLRERIFALRTCNSRSRHLPPLVSAALRLQQALTTTVDILYDHITSVTSVLSTTLRKHMESAESIDAMANIWTNHEMELQVSLLLTANMKPLRHAIISMLQVCEHDVWDVLVPETGVSTGDEGEPGAEIVRDTRGTNASSTHRTLLTLQSDIENSLSFVTAGLRATSRVAGNAVLEALADRLDWRVTR